MYATEEAAASAKPMITMEKKFLEIKNRNPLSLGVPVLMFLLSTALREFGKFVLIKFFC
jgi:gamma-glutamyltranspeptidase